MKSIRITPQIRIVGIKPLRRCSYIAVRLRPKTLASSGTVSAFRLFSNFDGRSSGMGGRGGTIAGLMLTCILHQRIPHRW
jgi:hypothetical protein